MKVPVEKIASGVNMTCESIIEAIKNDTIIGHIINGKAFVHIESIIRHLEKRRQQNQIDSSTFLDACLFLNILIDELSQKQLVI